MLLATKVAGANDLKELYELALTRDATLQAAGYQRDAAIEVRPQAIAPWLPQVSAVASASRERVGYESRSVGSQAADCALTAVGGMQHCYGNARGLGINHLESAVQLVKAGAADYIGKPWDNDKLLATVENLLELAEANRERQRLQDEQRRRRERLAAQYDLCGTVFASDAMERVVELACRVARGDVRVLITGPNGAGKERIAQIVHANSSIRSGPFVAVNCGAIPSELIEAELFGAEAGAFTGAGRARTGRFEAANGGTLFLDEIGDLPLAGQVKLLRVLETGQFEMLGSSRTRSAQVRVLSATNADLAALIREGKFREDLYYRLNVIEINVPALAERAADILPLARHFLGPALQLSDDAAAALIAHDWPGNVRELRNSIERAKLLAREQIVSAGDLNLPAPQRPPPEGEAPRRDAEQLSREVIDASLREAGGNISRAAQGLGLSRQALYRRMERFNLRPPGA